MNKNVIGLICALCFVGTALAMLTLKIIDLSEEVRITRELVSKNLKDFIEINDGVIDNWGKCIKEWDETNRDLEKVLKLFGGITEENE
jgi:hypothetical protein